MGAWALGRLLCWATAQEGEQGEVRGWARKKGCRPKKKGKAFFFLFKRV